MSNGDPGGAAAGGGSGGGEAGRSEARESVSSVQLRNAPKGVEAIVKVYNDDAELASEDAQRIFDELIAKYGQPDA